MRDGSGIHAWLETQDGQRSPIRGNLSFGRTTANEVVLNNERVSRRHAIIHSQGEGEFWLVDLGSRNGTDVNARRVQQPIQLRDGDQIRIGPFSFVFRQGGKEGDRTTSQPAPDQTLLEIQSAVCWLLVADVKGSTRAAQSTPPDVLAMQMGHWFSHCKELVEAVGGTMNKYLGDGFLAFWRVGSSRREAMASMISTLREFQKNGELDFRFVLHHGQVLFGGGGSLGEESLSGSAVNFVFRMEKLAGALNADCLLSEPVTLELGTSMSLIAAGEHPVSGFDGHFRFFKLLA
jgi:adenylate cyclase